MKISINFTLSPEQLEDPDIVAKIEELQLLIGDDVQPSSPSLSYTTSDVNMHEWIDKVKQFADPAIPKEPVPDFLDKLEASLKDKPDKWRAIFDLVSKLATAYTGLSILTPDVLESAFRMLINTVNEKRNGESTDFLDSILDLAPMVASLAAMWFYVNSKPSKSPAPSSTHTRSFIERVAERTDEMLRNDRDVYRPAPTSASVTEAVRRAVNIPVVTEAANRRKQDRYSPKPQHPPQPQCQTPSTPTPTLDNHIGQLMSLFGGMMRCPSEECASDVSMDSCMSAFPAPRTPKSCLSTPSACPVKPSPPEPCSSNSCPVTGTPGPTGVPGMQYGAGPDTFPASELLQFLKENGFRM